MENKEKIKKVYQKLGVGISNEALGTILKDKERTEGIIRLYKKEEMESMNYILGKPEDNKTFTKEELEIMNKIDLFDRKVVNVCKIIWDNRDNEEKLKSFLKQLKEGASKCM